ncbi:MAG: hypothetical protein HY661_07460 [Betaproteobacteria bacterium]|nr:hypothetical protein [Betaproteobacteria bacterium]
MRTLVPTRRMLPRWRDSASAVKTRDVLAVPRQASVPTAILSEQAGGLRTDSRDAIPISWQSQLERELALWEKAPTVGVAADILSFAIYGDAKPQLQQVARFILSAQSLSDNLALRQLAEFALLERDAVLPTPETALAPMKAIRQLRRRLRSYPDNPVALVDLAWVHARLGNSHAAHRALITARGLAPTNRHIVRALCRYLVHVGDAAAAQRYLERTSSTSHDPWLLSALVAVSQITGKPVRALKQARRMVSSADMAPGHVSELAGSLAAFEIEQGNLKEGRRLFDRALEDPTENVLAQVHWVARETGRSFEVRNAWKSAPMAYELQAYEAYVNAERDIALKGALSWHEDEPFSSRPVILASFLASLGEGREDYISLCQDALRSNPEDERLESNLVYLLIAVGRVEEAETRLRNLLRRSVSIESIANTGYLYLRVGQEADGRLLYEKAVDQFEKQGDQERAALALAFYSRALRESGFQGWRVPIERAKTVYAKLNSPALTILSNTMAQAGDSSLAIPLLQKKGVLNAWRYNKTTNCLVIAPSRILQLR